MAFNFLSLVNDVNARLNEVPLNETNFLSAGGWYAQAKESVNAAIRMIAVQEWEWPFNYMVEQTSLTKGSVIYPYPEGAQSVNFDSFRLVKDVDKNVSGRKLISVDYEEVIQKGINLDTPPIDGVGQPSAVFRMPNLQFGVYPAPNDNYKLAFDWHKLPMELENYQDVPFIPVQWKHVIVNGAMYYAYMFRGDPESSAVMKGLFDADIKNMRKLYQNRYEYVRGPDFRVGGDPYGWSNFSFGD